MASETQPRRDLSRARGPRGLGTPPPTWVGASPRSSSGGSSGVAAQTRCQARELKATKRKTSTNLPPNLEKRPQNVALTQSALLLSGMSPVLCDSVCDGPAWQPCHIQSLTAKEPWHLMHQFIKHSRLPRSTRCRVSVETWACARLGSWGRRRGSMSSGRLRTASALGPESSHTARFRVAKSRRGGLWTLWWTETMLGREGRAATGSADVEAALCLGRSVRTSSSPGYSDASPAASEHPHRQTKPVAGEAQVL